ncbi:vanadium-dependent haloperoxidase [Pseudovibrio sp. Tun.PSC04-5.I4]|uniref:vanadium-dependent haloperoxidase n=1 Tax=Pseudovibrio sp. Tun.PSC04-5.I4 TaxID=1798213 RepID=UPI00087FDDC7|nr:vanadium-dependent haloperoxidase [Pseudovibrio sp. Tun.PSC04-5.I4]SDQ33541.1 hypothetical protein SAMN04515695_0908 [Pseudovibrio sp. Tun.PSC04-5.I4]
MMDRFTWLRTLAYSGALAVAITGGAAQAEQAADWQESAMDLISAEKWPGAKRQRTLAVLHTAMFDAANAVDGTYAPYAYTGPTNSVASVEAAVTQAALHVMSTLMPERKVELEAIAEKRLASVKDPAARDAGVALGQAVAIEVLSARVADNADFSTDYTPGPTEAGVYQKTSKRSMVAPKISKMNPFVLSSATQFRVPPPPSLNSMQFQRGLSEVVELGGKETQMNENNVFIAKLHAGSGSGAWNQIAVKSSMACNLSLVEEARTLALLNIALTDALVAGFNAKYEYALWRPETAMNALGKTYTHPELKPDMQWSSLVAAPMHPEYPCQHCTSGSAAQEVLESVFGDGEFSFTFNGKGGLSKNYVSFQQFAEEESESRVMGGVHYRRSNAVGDMLGYQIGSYIAETSLQPIGDAANIENCTGSR